MCAGPEIMLIAGLAQSAGGVIQGFDAASQYEDRANQILESSKDQMRQGSKARERRRGAQSAAFAKGGVKMTGTAKVFTQQQIEQDEQELLKQKYNAQLEIKDTFKQAQEARTQGIVSGISGATGAVSNFNQLSS